MEKEKCKNRFVIIVIYRENIDRLDQSVCSCLEQMKESDQLIVLCKNEQKIADMLMKRWKKCMVTVKSADTVQNGYNEILSEIDSEYVLVIHEGDRIGVDYLSTGEAVMTGNISQDFSGTSETAAHEQEEDSDQEEKQNKAGIIKACIEDPQKIGILFADNYWDNPLLSSKAEQWILSKYTVKGIYAVDIVKNSWALQTALNGAIVRTSLLKRYFCNNKIMLEYETDVVLRLLLDEKQYLVCNQMKYYYFEARERQILYHLPAHFKEWYFESVEQYLLPLVNLDVDESTQPFLQNYIVYYVLCRFLCNMNNRNKAQVSSEEFDSYLSLLKKVLEKVDDYYLLNQERVPYLSRNPEILCMFLRIKYGVGQVEYNYRLEKDSVTGETDLIMYYKNHMLASMNSCRFGINTMNYIQKKVWIDGSLIRVFEQGGVKFYAEFNGKTIQIEDTDSYSLEKFFGIPAYRRITYHLELPLEEKKRLQRVRFYARYQDTKIPMKISFTNHWAKLTKSPRHSYWRFNRYLCHHADDSIVFKKATKFNVLKRELQFQLDMLKENTSESKAAFRMRWIYWITRPYFKKKRIWLLLDKLYKGGDSGEYMYRYSARKDDGITKYYLINRDTSDYRKLRRDGYKPLVNGSLLHKLVFMNADLILITNSHLFPFNGYTKERSKYIRGLCNFTSMCLQHGLSVQKCAIAQRRIIDNTTGYFLASKYEYENLSRHAYGYQGFDILKITGIARYDGLINNDKKQILLSPTWRMYNALPVTTSEGEQRAYNPDFKYTTYFKIYNNLINHKRLISCAKEHGYKIKFLLHPILSAQLRDFTPNPELEVIPSVGDLSYEKILTESSLMVTDYSGVQFDFAYMRKPVVYFHPEELPAHYEEGCFFYDTMGFGEICSKTEELVDLLCDYMQNGCKMKEKYIERADDFFAYNDQNNCERIYQELLKAQIQIDQDKLRNKD